MKELDSFSFLEFEKDFVLNHPSLKQTKSLQDSILVTSLSFEVATYKDKFPIFKNEPPARGTILFVFQSYIDKLLHEHRIATATHYQTAYNTFARFRGNVKFTDITVAYPNEFEHWMLAINILSPPLAFIPVAYESCSMKLTLWVLLKKINAIPLAEKNIGYRFPETSKKRYHLPM